MQQVGTKTACTVRALDIEGERKAIEKAGPATERFEAWSDQEEKIEGGKQNAVQAPRS
jgi:hypothetical protein